MPVGKQGFQRGREKTGGRARGVRNKVNVARERLTRCTLEAAGLTPEEVDKLTPLAVMRLIMTLWLKAGDLIHALEACAGSSSLHASEAHVV